MNIYKRLSPQGKLRVAIAFAATACCAALFCVFALLVYLEEIPVGPATSHLPPASPYEVELTLVDSPNLSEAEMTVIAKSILVVLSKRVPSYRAPLRIVAYGAGAPNRIPLDGGLAGYQGDLDLFVIDVTKAREAAPMLGLTLLEGWSFYMAHEATHLVQQLERRAGRPGRGEAYHADPLEREAFQEGFDLLSALKGGILEINMNGKFRLVTSRPNLYTAVQFAPAELGDENPHRLDLARPGHTGISGNWLVDELVQKT